MAVILFIPHFEKVDLIIASSARFHFLSQTMDREIMRLLSRKLLIGQNLFSAFLIVLRFAFSEMHQNVGNDLSNINILYVSSINQYCYPEFLTCYVP